MDHLNDQPKSSNVKPSPVAKSCPTDQIKLLSPKNPINIQTDKTVIGLQGANISLTQIEQSKQGKLRVVLVNLYYIKVIFSIYR